MILYSSVSSSERETIPQRVLTPALLCQMGHAIPPTGDDHDGDDDDCDDDDYEDDDDVYGVGKHDVNDGRNDDDGDTEVGQIGRKTPKRDSQWRPWHMGVDDRRSGWLREGYLDNRCPAHLY